MPSQTAFGGMLQDVVELNSIVLRLEPLDDEIERRCKQAWEQAACPECGQTFRPVRERQSPRLVSELPLYLHLHPQHTLRRPHSLTW